MHVTRCPDSGNTVNCTRGSPDQEGCFLSGAVCIQTILIATVEDKNQVPDLFFFFFLLLACLLSIELGSWNLGPNTMGASGRPAEG